MKRLDNILLHDTLQLIKLNQKALEIYKQHRATQEKGDFYKEVKPFADKVRDICERWEPAAIEWVQKNKPPYINAIQLHNTSENIQMVSIRAFFPESSLKRFMSHVQSVDYVLNQLLDELQSKK